MKKMKLFATIIAIVCTTSALSGCGIFRKDKEHAIIEVTNEAGEAYIDTSYNGLGMTWTGEKAALKGALEMQLKEGEKVRIHFCCDSCGHDERCVIEAPFAKMFKCDCPEDGGENDTAKEYYAVLAEIADEADKKAEDKEDQK